MSRKSGFTLKISRTKTGTTATSSKTGRKHKASDSDLIVQESSRAGDKKRRTHRFREVVEGKGSTYTLTQEPHHIGTRDLITCLGIYFEIDDERCFLAHVNFHIMGPDGKPRKPTSIEHYAMDSEDLCKAVRITMGEQLDEVRQQGGNWRITQRMRDTLIMASPFSGDDAKPMVADVLAQAVRRFLRISKADRDHAEYAIQKKPWPSAFIVHHNGPNQGGRFANVIWSKDLSAHGWTGVPEPGGCHFFCSAIRADGMTQDISTGDWSFERDANDVSDDDA